MIALPDGRTIYLEDFRAGPRNPKREIGGGRTGLVFLEGHGFWRRGDWPCRIYYPGGEYDRRMKEGLVLAGGTIGWLNVDDRFGMVVRSSTNIQIKSVRTILEVALNYRRAVRVKAGDPLGRLSVVFYPNATREETVRSDQQVRVEVLDGGMRIVNLGNIRIAVNLSDAPARLPGEGTTGQVQPLHAVVLPGK